MEKQQADSGPIRAKLDFSKVPTLNLASMLEDPLYRAIACAKVIEGSHMPLMDKLGPIDDDIIGNLAWQIIENLDMVLDVSEEMRSRFSPYRGPAQTCTELSSTEE